jgi:predicted phosphodiesterase
MKFGIISDLHMEFQPWLFEPEKDVFYLNAGDTHPNKLFRDYFRSLFNPMMYFEVMGNHDYYGGSFKDADMDVESFVIEEAGLKVAGATLWTDISPVRWWDFKEYMMDSRNIAGMNYDRYAQAHTMHRDFLFNAEADIWVVHHLPSYQSVNERFKDSNSNDFFATELAYKILDMKKPPKLIVHGHTHDPCDYMLGETRVICNPRGYPAEHSWYQDYQPVYVEINS